MGRLLAEGNDALLAALAEDVDRLLLEVDVCEVESDRFGAAEPARVGELERARGCGPPGARCRRSRRAASPPRRAWGHPEDVVARRGASAASGTLAEPRVNRRSDRTAASLRVSSPGPGRAGRVRAPRCIRRGRVRRPASRLCHGRSARREVPQVEAVGPRVESERPGLVRNRSIARLRPCGRDSPRQPLAFPPPYLHQLLCLTHRRRRRRARPSSRRRHATSRLQTGDGLPARRLPELGVEPYLEARSEGWTVETDDQVGRGRRTGSASWRREPRARQPRRRQPRNQRHPGNAATFRNDVQRVLRLVGGAAASSGRRSGVTAPRATRSTTSSATLHRRTTGSASSNGPTMVDEHPQWLASDGLHGNEPGYRERARAIADASRLRARADREAA